MSGDVTPEIIAELALKLGHEYADEIFNMHAKVNPSLFTEQSRELWTLGFLSGFSSGFTTCAMRAKTVIDRMPASRIPGQGTN